MFVFAQSGDGFGENRKTNPHVYPKLRGNQVRPKFAQIRTRPQFAGRREGGMTQAETTKDRLRLILGEEGLARLDGACVKAADGDSVGCKREKICGHMNDSFRRM